MITSQFVPDHDKAQGEIDVLEIQLSGAFGQCDRTICIQTTIRNKVQKGNILIHNFQFSSL